MDSRTRDAVLRLLKQPVTIDHLARRLKVTRRSVYRYVNQLNAEGIATYTMRRNGAVIHGIAEQKAGG